MKVYVAGKWKEVNSVREVMVMLKGMGHEVTCDWTGHVSPLKSKQYALEDMEGVRNCDVLLALMPDPTTFYKGAWIEVGMALAFNKLVMIVGKEVNSVFLGHPMVGVYKNEELFKAIEDAEWWHSRFCIGGVWKMLSVADRK